MADYRFVIASTGGASTAGGSPKNPPVVKFGGGGRRTGGGWFRQKQEPPLILQVFPVFGRVFRRKTRADQSSPAVCRADESGATGVGEWQLWAHARTGRGLATKSWRRGSARLRVVLPMETLPSGCVVHSATR